MTSVWRLLQYRQVVEAVLDSQPLDLESLEMRLDLLADRGNLCRRPISAPIEDGIFELRGTGPTRLLFYFRPNREIMFVHAVTKKQSKLDRKDIERAKRIRSQIEEDGEREDIDPVHDQD